MAARKNKGINIHVIWAMILINTIIGIGAWIQTTHPKENLLNLPLK